MRGPPAVAVDERGRTVTPEAGSRAAHLSLGETEQAGRLRQGELAGQVPRQDPGPPLFACCHRDRLHARRLGRPVCERERDLDLKRACITAGVKLVE